MGIAAKELEITVFVTDRCANCRAQIGVVERAVAQLGLDAKVKASEDVMAAVSAGVMGFPAIVAGGKVLSAAQKLNEQEVKSLLDQLKA